MFSDTVTSSITYSENWMCCGGLAFSFCLFNGLLFLSGVIVGSGGLNLIFLSVGVW